MYFQCWIPLTFHEQCVYYWSALGYSWQRLLHSPFVPLRVSRGQRVYNQGVGAVGPHQRQQHGAHRSLLRGGEKGVDHQSPALWRHRPRGRVRHPHRHPHCEFSHAQAHPNKWITKVVTCLRPGWVVSRCTVASAALICDRAHEGGLLPTVSSFSPRIKALPRVSQSLIISFSSLRVL